MVTSGMVITGQFVVTALSNKKWSDTPPQWAAKIRRNVERDKSISTELSDAGWTVLRIWESDIKKDVKACADQVEYAYWNIRRNQKTRGVEFDEST